MIWQWWNKQWNCAICGTIIIDAIINPLFRSITVWRIVTQINAMMVGPELFPYCVWYTPMPRRHCNRTATFHFNFIGRHKILREALPLITRYTLCWSSTTPQCGVFRLRRGRRGMDWKAFKVCISPSNYGARFRYLREYTFSRGKCGWVCNAIHVCFGNVRECSGFGHWWCNFFKWRHRNIFLLLGVLHILLFCTLHNAIVILPGGDGWHNLQKMMYIGLLG